MAYSQTEGYAPVTSKAQNSDEYRDYLSRSGEDNELYYDVKIEATKMLIENVENTFVTPVFNGSASLRSAAGHLIESVNKSVRRKETVDKAYLEKLYQEVTALYRLDQISQTHGKISLGALPIGSIALLSGLAVCWLGIGIYALKEKIKTRGAK